MLETLDELVVEGASLRAARSAARAHRRPRRPPRTCVKAIGKGLLKTISKMGISTIQSYCGAQIFEAVGLEPELVDKHFTGTASRIGGVGAGGARARGARAPRPRLPATRTDSLLPLGGVYAWRRDGEHHMWNPETIALVQHAVRAANGDVAAALTATSRPTTRCAAATPTRRTASTRRRSTRTPPARRRCAGCCASAPRPRADPARARSSPRARSSSASPPARCASARSPARRTRRSRSR